ncbi:MAG: PLDc N-terminal domain-containing protein [Albidovulum sp.]
MGGMHMFGVGGVGGLILLGLDIWAIISVLGSTASSGRKALWVLLIVVLPLLGFLIWLVAGPRSTAGGA